MKNNRFVKYPKYYTCKEWKRFDKVAERENGINITMQEIMLQKYDIILTDYKTRKEKVMLVLSKVNIQNINKGIDVFNKGVQAFSSGVGTKPTKKRKANKVKIWSDMPKPKKSTQKNWDNRENDLEKLFGKKRKFKL